MVLIPPSPPPLQTFQFAPVHTSLIFCGYFGQSVLGLFAPVRGRPCKSMVQAMVSVRTSMVSETAVLTEGTLKAAKARESAYRLGDRSQPYLLIPPSGGKHCQLH